MPGRRHLAVILISCLSFLIFCGDDSRSDRESAEFTFYIVGSGGVGARFGSEFYQTLESLRGDTGQLDEFLFTIAEEPLTMDQIQEISGGL